MVSSYSPLVSIGIPTYKRPQRLRATLASLTRQTYSNLEIIISDNCSPEPETEKVAQEFMAKDSRIRYFRQEENLGMFYNFKFVFDVSQGEFFAWAADDDIRAENYIEACLNIFQQPNQSPNLVLVNSYSQLIDPDSRQILKTDYGCTTVGLSPSERYQKYLSSIYTDQAAIGDLIYGVIKSWVLREAMNIQPNCLDWDHIFLGTLALKGEFYSIPKPLMSSAPGGMSTLKDVQKMAKIQLIENPLYIKKARWVRTAFLQRRLWAAKGISLPSKIKLSAWLMWNTLDRYLTIKRQKLTSTAA